MAGRPKKPGGARVTVNYTLDKDIIDRIDEIAKKDAGKYSLPNRSGVVQALLREVLGLNTPEIDGE